MTTAEPAELLVPTVLCNSWRTRSPVPHGQAQLLFIDTASSPDSLNTTSENTGSCVGVGGQEWTDVTVRVVRR